MNLSGIWTGTIVYGKLYRGHSEKEMIFEMTIEQVGDLFTGTCFDISGTGVNEDLSTIEGSEINGKIQFKKHYPSLHYYNNGETKVDRSQQGKEFIYLGEYDSIHHTFSGTWKHELNSKFLGIFPIKNPSGLWQMHRKNDLSMTILALALIDKGESTSNSYNLIRIFERIYRFGFYNEILEHIRQEDYVNFELKNGIHYYKLTSKGIKFLDHEKLKGIQILIERFPQRSNELETLFSRI